MKKIVLCIPTLTRGGAERVMTNLANQFEIGKYDVTLILDTKVDAEYPVNSGVKKTYLPQNTSTNKFIFYVREFILLRKAIKHENPNIALSFLDRYNILFLLATLGMKKVKRFSSVRNTFEIECSNWKKKLLVRMLFPYADGIILQTDEIKKRFETEKIRINSCVIPNQVSNQFFDRTFSGQRKNIVTVGRLDYQKNQELLIRAFAKIADDTSENLIIYGQGILKDVLYDIIKECDLENRVFLGGLIEDVPNTIIGSKLFVLSSDFEGSPNALLEAIALGIPSISTNCPCGGPKEIIEDGKNGFLIPVNDVDALAEKMKYVLSLPDIELDRISANARKTSDKFRPNNVFKLWEDFLIGKD